MSQIALPAVFMRGGTSKGLFFHRRDLPAERAEWDALFLAALGSPDPHGRQLDGMGGGISSLSKVVVVSPSARPGVDVDYLFGQVAVDRALVDYGSNCGNLTAAVGPLRRGRGAGASRRTARPPSPSTTATWTSASRRASRSRTAARRWKARPCSTAWPASGAPIRLSFMEPGGAVTGRLLPTGHARDVLDMPSGPDRGHADRRLDRLVIVRAENVGATGIESPEIIEADPALAARLEAIRRAGAAPWGSRRRPRACPRSASSRRPPTRRR